MDRLKFRRFVKCQHKSGFDSASLDGYGMNVLKRQQCSCLTQEFGEWQQCTGLKDKNGKLIYEGDVAEEVHPGSLLKCGWNHSQLRWSWYWIGTDSIYCHLGQGDTDPEIIGDIHTAPELLSE